MAKQRKQGRQRCGFEEGGRRCRFWERHTGEHELLKLVRPPEPEIPIHIGLNKIPCETEEFATVKREKLADSPGMCWHCNRPIIVAPFFTSGVWMFCSQNCRNDSRIKRGIPAVAIEGDGSRPASGSGVPLDRKEAVFVPVRCPACGSQKREKFTGSIRRVETCGVSPVTGERYNVVLFRSTRCKAKGCGQPIAVKSYEWEDPLDSSI